jgi:p24 family protein delta-1
MAFTSHGDSAIDVCFENILSEGSFPFLRDIANVGHAPGGYKTVELDVDIGSSAFDYAAIQKNEVHPLSVRGS